MKQIKFFAMALAAMSMFSCSNEETNPGEAPAQDGKAYAQFSLAFAGATRADANAVGNEATITDAKVYVISAGKIEAVATLAQVGTTEVWRSPAMELITGDKAFFAVVNGGTHAVSFNVGDALSTINTKLVVALTNAINDTNALFTSQLTTATLVKPANGNVRDIPVIAERVIAKIVVRDNISISTSLPVTYTKTTTPASAQFAVNGQTGNIGLYQHRLGDGTPTNMASMTCDFRATPGAGTPKLTFYPLADTGTALGTIGGKGGAGGIYAMENVVGTATLANKSTQLYVSVVLKPTGKYTNTDNTQDTAVGANYLVVKHATNANQYLFFRDATEFGTWRAEYDKTGEYAAEGVLYTGGVNYYAVKIVNGGGNAVKFSVLRNNIYDVTLNKVNEFGGNETSTIIDGTKPLEEKTSITASVTIKNWNVITQGSDLN